MKCAMPGSSTIVSGAGETLRHVTHVTHVARGANVAYVIHVPTLQRMVKRFACLRGALAAVNDIRHKPHHKHQRKTEPLKRIRFVWPFA